MSKCTVFPLKKQLAIKKIWATIWNELKFHQCVVIFMMLARWKPIDFLSFIVFFLAFKEKELRRQQAEILKHQVGIQHNLLIPLERNSYCWIKPFNSDVSKNLQACMCVWLSDYICASAYILIQVCVRVCLCLYINVVSISLYLTPCLLVLDLLLLFLNIFANSLCQELERHRLDMVWVCLFLYI